jgi:hypothetical protein
LQTLQDFAAQRILTDARDDAAARPQSARVVREVGGRAPELFARGEQVPGNFADANDVYATDCARYAKEWPIEGQPISTFRGTFRGWEFA